MDKIFLEKYHQELKFFRDASKEFAEEHPKAATRLGLSAPEIEDPYVERLIEAVSFLTARVNLKIDSEYPQFVQHILKVIHPDLTQSIPSAGIVQLVTDHKRAFNIPKLAQVVTYDHAKGFPTCQFSVCNSLQIVPFTIEKIRYSQDISQLLIKNTSKKTSKAVLNFDVCIPAGFSFEHLKYADLRWHIGAADLKVSSELMYFLVEKLEYMTVELEGVDDWKYRFIPDLYFLGFDEYLSLHNNKSASYLKHIVEYAVLPEKYLFFTIKNLEAVFKDLFFKKTDLMNVKDDDKSISNPIKLKFNCVFNDTSEVLDRFLDSDSLSFNSVVLNNIFKRRTRVIVDQFKNEQHVVVDKLRPADYEVLKIDKIEGYSKNNHKVKIFEPIYKLSNDTDHFDDSSYGFFSELHKQSFLSSKKNSYKGSECYVMLTNQLKAVVEDELNQLSITAWCSNRAIPSEISWSLDKDLKMSNDAYKVTQIRRKTSFSQPISAPLENASLWRLLNLVSSNYIPLHLDDTKALTQQIKNNLYLFYEITGIVSFKSQVNAILNIQASRVRTIKKIKQQLTPVNGLKFEIIIDDMLMSHVHPYLWGRILLEYLKSFAHINQYVELSLKSKNKTTIADYISL
ncbi:type VI secretion system baseplate subunit TssF [Acinetobacter rudis]|uniref:Type VI secretion protein n=1 Tax=Acinetobacter rudis CIP 110305 TaxID=421052 RepID=S3N3M4_9GAMM|nr:type VI secretion system baseplate subunit TssF [Acinetobacter rudis]EPF74382.1 type VI secretion protein [Acinetobacter rudis CIP 110305]